MTIKERAKEFTQLQPSLRSDPLRKAIYIIDELLAEVERLESQCEMNHTLAESIIAGRESTIAQLHEQIKELEKEQTELINVHRIEYGDLRDSWIEAKAEVERLEIISNYLPKNIMDLIEAAGKSEQLEAELARYRAGVEVEGEIKHCADTDVNYIDDLDGELNKYEVGVKIKVLVMKGEN